VEEMRPISSLILCISYLLAQELRNTDEHDTEICETAMLAGDFTSTVYRVTFDIHFDVNYIQTAVEATVKNPHDVGSDNLPSIYTRIYIYVNSELNAVV